MQDSRSNMEIVQLIFGLILLATVWFITFRIASGFIRRSSLSKEELKFDEIRSVYKKLKENKEPKVKLITKYADDVETRIVLYEALVKFNRVELFPKELSSLEKLSESHLANWLDLNEDFDCLPDKMEFVENHEFENDLKVLVFKFKKFDPSISDENGWMFGYVGFNITVNAALQEPKFITSDFSDKLLNENELRNKF